MNKKLLKKYLPKSVVAFTLYIIKLKRLLVDCLYDLNRYKKHSATLSLKESAHLEGRIIAQYHIIEKGLSYKNLKPGFGQEKLINLINLLKKYSSKNYNIQNTQYIAAVSAVKKYIETHENYNYDVSSIKTKLAGIKLPVIYDFGGSIELSRKELLEKRKINFKELALSRHSIRDFTDEDVEYKMIEEIIRIAQKSPSVCNRQTSRVYIVSERKNIDKHLLFQSGNRGFGHKINKLLVVTSDLNYFQGPSERNQSYVDGGIFSMSLLYAIHYLGLGAVALNWCAGKKRDLAYRKFSGINENENIILMIGIGHIPEIVKVPKSKRRNLQEIIRYI